MFLRLNDNESALIQTIAWLWTGNKPLSESMLVYSIDAYVTQSRWVKIWLVITQPCSDSLELIMSPLSRPQWSESLRAHYVIPCHLSLKNTILSTSQPFIRYIKGVHMKKNGLPSDSQPYYLQFIVLESRSSDWFTSQSPTRKSIQEHHGLTLMGNCILHLKPLHYPNSCFGDLTTNMQHEEFSSDFCVSFFNFGTFNIVV